MTTNDHIDAEGVISNPEGFVVRNALRSRNWELQVRSVADGHTTWSAPHPNSPRLDPAYWEDTERFAAHHPEVRLVHWESTEVNLGGGSLAVVGPTPDGTVDIKVFSSTTETRAGLLDQIEEHASALTGLIERYMGMGGETPVGAPSPGRLAKLHRAAERIW